MPPKKATIKEKYTEAVGRRKTATARVRLTPKKSAKEVEVTVNGKEIGKYFPVKRSQDTVHAPFKALALKEYVGNVIVSGGGVNAQAEAIRLGFSRALVALDPSWRPALKTLGFLKRDPRMVERKKFGSRKARRPQQWRKR